MWAGRCLSLSYSQSPTVYRLLLIRLGQSALAVSYWGLLRYTIALFDGALNSSHLLKLGIYRGGCGQNILFRDRRAKGWTIKKMQNFLICCFLKIDWAFPCEKELLLIRVHAYIYLLWKNIL